MNDRVKLWLAETRAPFFTATIVPILLGAVVAWARGEPFHWGLFLLTLLGGLLMHAGANMINDYMDHLRGTDVVNVEFVRPFTGGSRMIQEGLLTPRQILTASLLCFALGSVVGFYLASVRGWVILLIGAVGLFSAVFYVTPGFSLSALGVGELFIGLNFGVLMTLGAYIVQTGRFSWEAVLASLPVALLIAAVLYINEFQDAAADAAVGRTHLVVRLGKRLAAQGYAVLMFAVYLSLLLGVLLDGVTPWALLGLLTVPLAFKAVRVALVHYDDSQQLVPANAGTIQVHMLTGLLMIVGYVIQGFL
ncbi:MAG: 1,4-dihydroxy-2-naphthoate octaprenyltransferase [Chloroflexi bacterium]|nr:1,4-dihydroxy-2-naphthoate octaprenyltransferase [Chloroflexota bacterium]